MTLVELAGTLITGGVGVEIIRRAFTPAESRQIDSTAMRSELWKRVEKLEADVKDLHAQVATLVNERDCERDEKRRYRTGYERADEYTRRQGQAILMTVHLRKEDDDEWEFWLNRLAMDANSIPNFLPPVDDSTGKDEGGPSRIAGGSHA